MLAARSRNGFLSEIGISNLSYYLWCVSLVPPVADEWSHGTSIYCRVDYLYGRERRRAIKRPEDR